MKLRYILSIFLILTLAYSLSAQSDLADAEYLYQKKTYTLNKDGSWDYNYKHKLKYNTHYSFHRLYGETFVVYNPDFQTLKVLKSETTMADGKKVDSPKNAFNKVLPSFAANAPAYNHLTEMVITHTALEVGAVVSLEYELHTKKGFMPNFMGNVDLASYSPIKELIVEVVVPKSVDLQYVVKNVRIGPQITTRGAMKVYTWKLRNVKMLAHEILTGENDPQMPRLLFADQKLYKTFSTFTNQKAFMPEKTSVYPDFISDLKKKNKKEIDLVFAISDKVVNEINTYRIPGKYTAYKARTMQEVLKSNGGTALEKTLLLRHLYRMAGFKAEAVALFPRLYFVKNQGNLFGMEEYAVRVKTKDLGTIYVSATENLKRGLDKIKTEYVFLEMNPALESLRKKETMHEIDNVSFAGEIEWKTDDKIEIDAYFKREGQNVPYFDIKKDENNAKNEVKRLRNSEFENFTIKAVKPDYFEASFAVTGENQFFEVENYKVFNLPKLEDYVDHWRVPFIESNRKMAVVLPNVVDQEYHYEVELSKNQELMVGELDVQKSNKLGQLSMRISKTGKRHYSIKYHLKIQESYINPSDVDDLIELVKPWLNERNWQLMIK